MTDAVAVYMSSSSFAIESAWAVLKQDDSLSEGGMPQEGFGAILNSMRPEDLQAALDHYHRLPPDEQRILQATSQSMGEIPEDKMGQLRASAHHLFQQHEGNFSQLMQDSGEGPVDLNKIAPLLLWGAVALTAVFVADDVNRSQGAKASLVGNVVTDIGNAAAWANGSGDAYFGETDYGDVVSHDDEVGYVDPFTGQRHFVDSDPSAWDSIKFGGMTAATSLINPFKPLSSMKAGAKLGARLASKTATKPVNVIGSRIAGSNVARLSDEAVQAARVAQETGQVGAARSFRPTQNLDYTVTTPQMHRQSRLDAQAADRAAIDARWGAPKGKLTQVGEGMSRFGNKPVRESLREFGEAGAKSGWKRGVGWGAARAYGHTPAGQDWMDENIKNPVLGLLGAYGMSKLPDGTPDTSGGYGGQGAFGTAATGGAAGGYGQGYGMQDTANVTGNRMGEDALWTNTAAPFQGQHGRGTMAQRTVENQGSFGGFGKGDNMKIGERMLKEAQDMMYKAVCPKCGKQNCNCKEYKNKKEDGKKPSHGMVIVIGSKAGPGPSTDGKRDKVDSDKDKKEE